MPVIPNASLEPPAVSNQFFEQSGKPIMGDPADVPWSEFSQQAMTVVRGCCGNFDTAHPNQQQMGRTYHEVLTHAAAREFHVWTPPLYRWVTCEKYGVRPIVFIQWIELSYASRNTVRDINKKRFLNGRPKS